MLTKGPGKWKAVSSLVLISLLLLAAAAALLVNDLASFLISGIAAIILFIQARGRKGEWDWPTYVDVGIVVLAYLLLSMDILIRQELESTWLWDLVTSIISGLILGGFGLIVLLLAVRDRPEAMGERAMMVAFMAFSVGVCIGTIWEMMEFVLDASLGIGLQRGLEDTMIDLGGVALGALVMSATVHSYVKHGNRSVLQAWMDRIIEDNQEMFVKSITAQDVRRELGTGESIGQEFKSSLRTNMMTGEIDKRMEHAVMKTVVAFLNSDGGTLYIGVNDDGRVVGIDVQHFPNQDKYMLHFMNLFAQVVGKEALAMVEPRFIDLDEGTVLRVSCNKGKGPTFLRMDNREQFFVRSGASSIELSGKDLVTFVGTRFGR